MADKSGPSGKQAGEQAETSNIRDSGYTLSLQDLVGFNFPDPFDDFEKTMAYLDAFDHFLQIEAQEGRPNRLLACAAEVEISAREKPQIFHDSKTGTVIFRLPSLPNETADSIYKRQLQVLCEFWPILAAKNPRGVAEIIKLLTPSARQRFLEKFSRRNGGHGNGE